MKIFLIVLVVIIVLALLYVVGQYNALVVLRNKVRDQFSQIDIQLKRRFDLIPNLVETVKGYMKHEEETLTKVTELRTSWAKASSINEKAELDNKLSDVLKTIMAVSENYPDLKANQNFLNLEQELKETENKISYARQFYNDSVTIYNTKTETIPTNIIASLFGFKAEELYKAESEEAKQNVKVNFN